MALKTVNEESLVAIGDAIRGKTGSAEALNFPNGMVDAINGISTNSGSVLPKVISGSIVKLNEEDFGNIYSIRSNAFFLCSNLTDVIMPDTIGIIENNAFSGCSNLARFKMSKNIRLIEYNVFKNCSKLTSLRLETSEIPGVDTNSIPSWTQLEVPGKMYDAYLNADTWGTTYRNQLVPYSEYVSTLSTAITLEYNSSKTFEISLQNYMTSPEVSINIEDPTIAKAIINNVDTETISLTISSLSTGGITTVEIMVPGEEDFVFTRQIKVSVVAELVPSSYSVENIDGVTYGFELNDNGFYESMNKGIATSFAYCKINISNMQSLPVYIDCINYAEGNYDFGLFSAVNTDLTKDISNGVFLHSFKGLSSPNIQTLEYLDAIGNCYITVKYRKDSSGNENNDSLQFKVRFGE